MTLAKRLAGYTTLFLAVLGLLLCVGVSGAAWLGKRRADAIGTAVFQNAHDAFGFVDSRLERLRHVLSQCRQRVGGMASVVARLKDVQADVKTECAPLLQTLAEMRQELQAAESWLDASRALTDGVQKVSTAVLSSEYAARHPEAAGLAVAHDMQTLAEALSDVLAKLEALRTELTALRDKQALARQLLAGIAVHVTDLDERLARLSARLGQLDARILHAQAACTALNRDFRGWTMLVAATITAVAVWFGFSQVVTIGYGRRLAHAAATTRRTAENV